MNKVRNEDYFSAVQLNEKGSFKKCLNVINDAIVFSFVLAIETRVGQYFPP